MARVLAYTTPARGHLYPVTGILTELQARGHRVAVRTLASEVRLMRGLGFDAAEIDPQIEAVELTDWQVKGARASLRRSVETFTRRAALDAPDLQRAIEAERPDVLLVDVNAWGALAVAEAWGGPWAMFSPFPLPLRSVDAPPFGPGLPPARGSVGQWRDRALRPLVLGGVERIVVPASNRVRASVGVPAVTHADEIFSRAPLVLAMTAEPFEYPRRDWPDSVALVGPCVWEPPQERPAWLTGLDRPLVLITNSSEYQGDEVLARTAMEALADEPVAVVVTMPASSAVPLADVPANARVERFVPHGPLLERAAVAVTHGGMGATQKALAHGVPVVAVPFGRDQLEVARRVAVSGGGLRLPARRLTPERLRRTVHEAMGMTEGARRVQRGLLEAGGARAGADLVEGRLLSGIRS